MGSKKQPRPDSSATWRMDFVIRDAVFDDEKQSITAYFMPDPRRYERSTEDGRPGWYDRLDHLFFDDALVAKMVQGMPGVPMYAQAPRIEDALEYAQARRPVVELALKRGDDRQAADPSAEFLDSLVDDRLGFAILVLDVVGSTVLSQRAPEKTYAQVMSVVITELAEAVSLFHGHVLKYTGDGLIAYFPEPSFNRMNDMALDCAMTMTLVLREAINPALTAAGLPRLDLRFGLESGDVVIVAVGAPASKRHRDLIGQVINMAAKLQAAASAGDVVVGESMERHLHVDWRLQLSELDPPDSWPYTRANGERYRIFRVAGPGARVSS